MCGTYSKTWCRWYTLYWKDSSLSLGHLFKASYKASIKMEKNLNFFENKSISVFQWLQDLGRVISEHYRRLSDINNSLMDV